MKILIVGATGATGRELVRQAIAKGHVPTVLVRDSSKASFDVDVKVVVGDVLDINSLRQAVIGQEAVINSLGSAPSGPFRKSTLLSEGTRNLVEAMKGAKVDRLINITGIGAGESKGHGPWFYNLLIQPLVLRGTYQDKTRQEMIVRQSGLDWTLVRPAILTNGPGKGLDRIRSFTELKGIHVGTISRTDVAAFCLRDLVERRFIGQAPVITH